MLPFLASLLGLGQQAGAMGELGSAAEGAYSTIGGSNGFGSSLLQSATKPYRPVLNNFQDFVKTYKDPNMSFSDKAGSFMDLVQQGNAIANNQVQQQPQQRSLVGQPKAPQLSDEHLTSPNQQGIRYFSDAGKKYLLQQLQDNQ